MNKQEIQQVVESYIKNENARYALLISGAWGCGKTFLYENYLADAISALEVGKNNRKTNIYISLYGMNSIEALSKQLLSNYLIYAKANGNDIVRKGVKAVSGILGAASRAFSFSAGAVSMDLEKLNELSTTIEVKDLVICFDDLERCSISISEVFGYINNLIEHCNCKVIILADEDNIGKTYANINVEQKYQTILTGGRKVIRDKPEDKTKRTDLATDELTMKELKQLNETLYSENYIYRDIKEKVIGKTCKYTPGIEESLKDLIMGNAKSKGYLEEGKYRQFLTEHMDKIVNAFHEAGNNNLRVAAMWIDLFEEIYKVTCKNFNESEYYEEIVVDFLRYSIWIVVADRDNKTLISNLSYYGDQKYVHFENHKYTYTAEYFFVNKYMRNAYLDEAELVKAARDIEKRCKHEKGYKKQTIKSQGETCARLYEWKLMEDDEIRNYIKQMLKELEENKYAYEDYSNILILLIMLQKYHLYKGDIAAIQSKMLSFIDTDENVQEERRIPLSFSDSEVEEKFKFFYDPIAEKRRIRNAFLEKKEIEEENAYENAQKFLEKCTEREEYYLGHKSFMEYIDQEKLMKLIKKSTAREIYAIVEAFKAVYYMGNLNDFYVSDIEMLTRLKNSLTEYNKNNVEKITNHLAVEALIVKIENVLEGLR